MEIYSSSDRVSNTLNNSAKSNPWNALDAFMAAGLYLSDLGANSSYTSKKMLLATIILVRPVVLV